MQINTKKLKEKNTTNKKWGRNDKKIKRLVMERRSD